MMTDTNTPPRARTPRKKTILITCMALIILIPAGVGFTKKLVEFFHTYSEAEGGAFALIPIANYMLVTAGFCCLLVWAIAHGMFRDIERPKHTMLETESRLDKDEGHPWSNDA